jgi:hemoglobin/transferrin/lactoferrin receptor protein
MRKSKSLLVGGLFASVSTLSVSAGWAQDEESDFLLDEIRINSSESQDLLGNTQVTEEDLEDRAPTSMADVFRGKSQVSTAGGAAIAQKVFVQGIEESLLSVTIDGARQNKGAFHHAGNVLLDPALLKQVDVSAGLAPADSGPGGLGGAIAYETKDADDLLAPDDNFGGFASVSISDNDDDYRGTLALYGRQRRLEYMLSSTRHTSDDYADGDGNIVEGTGAELESYLGKLAYTFENNGRLEFSASHTEDTGVRSAQRGFIRPDFGGIVGLPNQEFQAKAQRKSYSLTYSANREGEVFSPEVQLAWNEQFTDAGDGEGTNISLSGAIKNDFQLENGVVTAGLDFFDDEAKGSNQRTDRSTGDIIVNGGRETVSNIGVFAQARQNFGSRLSASYGARVDSQSFKGVDGSRFSATGVSANGALDYLLTDSLTFTAGLATTWGGYQLGEAALINFSHPWTYDGMVPSRSYSGRVGLRYELGDWDVRGALFRTDIKDLASVLPVPGGSSRAEIHEVETSGLDFSAGYTGANGYVRLNYTYADVKVDDSSAGGIDFYIGRPVGHLIGIETAWDIDDQFRLGGVAEIALKNNDTQTLGPVGGGNTGVVQENLPSYSVVNVFSEYRPRNLDNLVLRLDIRNLFDETYVRRSADGNGYYRAVALNEPGRTFALTARVEF